MEQPKILSFGYRLDRLTSRSERLRDAGYIVDMASDASQAEFLARKNCYAAAVLGAAVPTRDRNRIAELILAKNRACAIVMLYEGSIRNAELADAVLNCDTAEQNLPETIRHLLSQRRQEASSQAAR
jgi:DNA-binding response OmpR family regulator